MKQWISFLLAIGMLFSFAACGAAEQAKEPAPAAAEEERQEESTEEATEDGGGLEVDRGIFNVTITIPAEFMDEGKTQADYDAQAAENGYKSATLNDDGSVTFVMTRAQHEKMMEEARSSIEQSLSEMCNSEDYPSFVAIDTNSDYTEFTITTTSEELGLMEGISVLGFYLFGGMYNAFNGTPVDNIHVVFVNEATGAVISESNSSALG